MFGWLLLIALLVSEALALRWWLRKEYLPFFFNGWAPTIYSVVLALDFILAWGVTALTVPGGSGTLAVLAIIGVALVVIVVIYTLFFRWVVRHDMTDIPD